MTTRLENSRCVLVSLTSSIRNVRHLPTISPLSVFYTNLHRTSLLTTLGLRTVPANVAQPPIYAASAIITNWWFACWLLSTRSPKKIYRLDHNVSPREDIGKYGEKMVQAGKLTRGQLNMLIRYVYTRASCGNMDRRRVELLMLPVRYL